MRRFFARFANVFRARDAEPELAREIESHLALLEEEFERRGLGDRHQFRFIVSAEDGVELKDLKTFTRHLKQGTDSIGRRRKLRDNFGDFLEFDLALLVRRLPEDHGMAQLVENLLPGITVWK